MSVSIVDGQDGFAKLRDGGEIAYQIRGGVHGGIPVLLLRPLGGSAALWGTFRTVLSEKQRVISFDYRGTGHSTRDAAWVSTRGLAGDSLQVLDHLGAQRAHVFGISLGGMVATWLAIASATRVAKLCIASAPSRGLEWTRAGILREIALAGCLVGPREDIEARLLDRILTPQFRDRHLDEVQRMERPLRAEPTSRIAIVKHALAGILHNASHRLQRIVSPTLVLAGQNDTLLGIDAPRALSEAIPGATFEIIAGAGHDLTLEQPIVTATRLSEFFMS